MTWIQIAGVVIYGNIDDPKMNKCLVYDKFNELKKSVLSLFIDELYKTCYDALGSTDISYVELC